MLTSKAPVRLLIVGGGIGGTTLAKQLANHPGFDITLVDRQNHYVFQPLLYQVATAALGSPDIAVPIRFLLSKAKNVRVLQADVLSLNTPERRIETSVGPIPYDILVLATGVETSYFGHPEWEEFAPGLKTLADAALIREKVLSAYEKAEATTDPAEHKRHLTFVVVGGGPTGAELAGSLLELAHEALAQDFRTINPKEARVILVEAGPRLVPMFSEALSASALADLRRDGVEVRLKSKVTHITERGVWLGEEFIPAANVIWAAGVRGTPLAQQLPAPLGSWGRVKVAPDCSVPGHPDLFVIGDLAHFEVEGKTGALPAVGGVALQQGNHLARTLKRDFLGKPRKPFRYFDRGQMATITRHHALVEVRSFRLAGTLAWWMWLIVHVVFMAGFRNRLAVTLHWAWTYATLQRGARLIVRAATSNDPRTGRDG